MDLEKALEEIKKLKEELQLANDKFDGANTKLIDYEEKNKQYEEQVKELKLKNYDLLTKVTSVKEADKVPEKIEEQYSVSDITNNLIEGE